MYPENHFNLDSIKQTDSNKPEVSFFDLFSLYAEIKLPEFNCLPI